MNHLMLEDMKDYMLIYLDKLINELLIKPINTLQIISADDTLKIIMLNLYKYKCSDLAAKTLNLINIFFSTIIIEPTLSDTFNNLRIKFIHKLIKLNMLDYIAKILVNTGKGFNEIRDMMSSIYHSLIMISINEKNDKLYVFSVEKLLLYSLLTRHMIFCVICYDIKNLLSLKEFEIDNNRILVNNLKINEDTPNYIKAWVPNSKKYKISITGLGLIPYLIKEILKSGKSILFEDKTNLLKMINNIKIAMKHVKITNNAQIYNIIDSCNYVKTKI